MFPGDLFQHPAMPVQNAIKIVRNDKMNSAIADRPISKIKEISSLKKLKLHNSNTKHNRIGQGNYNKTKAQSLIISYWFYQYIF